MLKKIRIITASAVFLLLNLLFLDFTGTIHLWFGWLAKGKLRAEQEARNFLYQLPVSEIENNPMISPAQQN